MNPRRPAWTWGAALCGLLAAALLASLLLGSVSLAPAEVLRALLGDGDPQTVVIVRDLRLPRALLAVLVVYAREDVIHLLPLHDGLRADLEQR